MRILKSLVILLTITGITLYSCKKDAHTTVTSDAVIRNSGPVNGCGYIMVVQINNGTFSPTNLTSEFMPTDSLKVRVTYNLLNTYSGCTGVEGGYRQVEITSISKIN